MNLRYGLEDRLSAGKSTIYAVQWIAVSLPFVIIAGTLAAGHHFSDPGLRTLYLQKATFVTALMLLAQAFIGHRLTLISGSATALLLGIVGSGANPDATYTAMGLCGVLLALVSAAGLFGWIRTVFTARVTATVLLLIAFTMTPIIVRLITAGATDGAPDRLLFAAFFTATLFVAHRFLSAAGRSLLIVAGMAAGSFLYYGIFGGSPSLGSYAPVASFFSGFTSPVFDAGTVLSFLFCFLALALNEIGSIQAVAPFLQPDGMERRVQRGMTVAGMVNAVAGFLGVIGPIDFSVSPGVIAATGCGSRYPLIPAALILVAASFSPLLLGLAGAIPPTVIASILIYTLAGQAAAGFGLAFVGGRFTFEDGLVVALPLLAGTVVAHLPPSVVAAFPPLFRSVAGNGFVVGVVAALLLDQLFRIGRK
ncbi:purine/pyrimidine permease [Geomonas sp. RF6]|uniref:uracil-xanthine permease family protein n=1 Tax=Geomonas sp. RF6 TaxID=2897342 RepID=UPI001E6265CD|nr:solute carrier family 23 protein [Geomonas sp. RF6]UFS72098.1 purine/pyrimidine permease [Geomonas sp. RF6]